MRNLKGYNSFINELEEFIDRSDRNKEIVRAYWIDGTLIIDPTKEDIIKTGTKGFFGLNIKVERKRKIVKILPVDDWSDIKIIDKLQMALKDMILAGVIDQSWDCIITSDKLTIRSLGSKVVKDILKYDSSYEKIIPYAFHGTTTYHINRILKEGILPRSITKVNPNWTKGYVEKSPTQIYLTIDYNRALYYAEYAVDSLEKRGIKSDPIVLEIKDLPIDKVVADDDFENNVSMMQLLDMLKSGKSKKQEEAYIKSIRNSGQFAIKDKIEPNKITKVYKPKKEEEL